MPRSGDFLPDAELAALTTTGGLLLVGVALRLLELKQVKVADLLPALRGRTAAHGRRRRLALNAAETPRKRSVAL